MKDPTISNRVFRDGGMSMDFEVDTSHTLLAAPLATLLDGQETVVFDLAAVKAMEGRKVRLVLNEAAGIVTASLVPDEGKPAESVDDGQTYSGEA